MTNHTYNFIMDIVSSKNLSLSKSENIIVNKLKTLNIDLEASNISSFSKSLDVSNSTVTRFAQKLGFDGFSELKFKYSQRPRAKISKTQEIYKLILDSLKDLDEDMVNFIKSFSSFEKIAVIGIGSSGLAANEFVYKFGEVGLHNTDYAKEPYSIDLLTKSLDSKDLLIAISLTGENLNLLEGVHFAKERKASILAISKEEGSSLDRLADKAILIPPYPSYSYTISKLFPVTLVLDLICEVYLS
ncbi:MAG: MurR/RpiR family transcriptional regulator [Anaerococcus sp.]|nr:MurR/RpiR family transcriptional regulator [Anaerococcus sp.]